MKITAPIASLISRIAPAFPRAESKDQAQLDSFIKEGSKSALHAAHQQIKQSASDGFRSADIETFFSYRSPPPVVTPPELEQVGLEIAQPPVDPDCHVLGPDDGSESAQMLEANFDEVMEGIRTSVAAELTKEGYRVGHGMLPDRGSGSGRDPAGVSLEVSWS